MFARTVTVRLKNNMAAEFKKTLENEILPLLRKQRGFPTSTIQKTRAGSA